MNSFSPKISRISLYPPRHILLPAGLLILVLLWDKRLVIYLGPL